VRLEFSEAKPVQQPPGSAAVVRRNGGWVAVSLDTRLGALHRALGITTVVLFIATGLVMLRQNLDALPIDSGLRLLFRSRHLYLLFGGLVNLALGLRFALPPTGGARTAALLGSGLTLLSPPLLLAAFVLEPLTSATPGLASALGCYAAFGGVLLYSFATWRAR
jgi:hypothetical protein